MKYIKGLISELEIEKKTIEKTNKKMMILSCIGIILVVLGHTGNKMGFASELFPIYSFHMALFVFISGYFYDTKYENKIFGKKGYILKKVKKLVVPYFVWNLIYGLIVTLAKKLNIVLYGQTINFNSFFIRPWTTGHQYILNIPAWFLLALFLVNICYILIRVTFKNIKLWNDYFFGIIFFVIAISIVYLAKNNTVEMYIPLFRTCFFMFFYHLGYLYKIKIEGKVKVNTIIYFIVLIIMNLILFKINSTLSYEAVFMKFKGKNIFVPIFASITGILFFLKISEVLEPSLSNSKIVNYISNNTFDIMMHHLFWVFAVNVVLFKISGIFNLSGFNVKSFQSTIYYVYTAGVPQIAIIYTILSIVMPLSIKWISEKIRLKLICTIKRKKEYLILLF